ncbi:ferritin-like domain-containing protein [Actinotalea sp. M2MS4P-6]|uniref:ferritin-like domain-containing protein n=1 Tax=Actinotalea sp. M2MS4P-6 TaxID=2983762 RepID=UPI0021E42394|nr:ferritin-like domain-containing protein [Actinotalea sp. M2MS4P-6]MCV2396537.1 ferritin-like domain-containing protein [Actinotalea sp. M2MS4P-6]
MTALPTSPSELAADRALPLLGMVAYGELAAFTRLAADSAIAPTLTDRLALAGFAGHALDHVRRLDARIVELGGAVNVTMDPFAGVLAEFDRRTEPSTWAERMLKAYVGYGVSDDFSRILAGGVESTCRDLLLDVLSDHGHTAYVVDLLAEAGAADATLAPRLALWGRRLVGESLGVVQGVLAGHREIVALLELVLPGDEPQQRLFAQLTAEHTRRMDRLGFAA